MNLFDIEIDGFETLFLDRDGVINIWRPNDYVKCWEEFEFVPGILEVFKKWNDHFKHIIIFTNQRGVGKGLMSEDDLYKIHEKMIDKINQCGGRIDHIYFCTSTNNNDPRRKPNPEMAYEAKSDFPDIDFLKTLMIGDKESDVLFAKNINCKIIMV